MGKWEKQEFLFQNPRGEQIDQKIAELEADGWQLVERIKGVWIIGTDVIPHSSG